MRRVLILSIASVIGAACRCTAPDLSSQRFACESSADCVAPHVCLEGECVNPSTTGLDAGEPDSGVVDAGVVDSGVPDSGIAPTCAAAGCSADATCDEGPPVVCTCKPGFTGDGRTCADVDECATANGGCDPNAVCANTPGSRTCACTNGWTGSGTVCTDLDE